MTEMEMVRELRRVVAESAGQVGGNREKVKAEIRAQAGLDGQGKVRETPLVCIMDVVGTNRERRQEAHRAGRQAPRLE